MAWGGGSSHHHGHQERKHQHINKLVSNHEAAFAQMKEYYQQITRDNCALLDKYEAEVKELLANQKKNATYLEMAMKERERLKTPLEAALSEVADLQFKLKDAPKTKTALQGFQGRLKMHQKK